MRQETARFGFEIAAAAALGGGLALAGPLGTSALPAGTRALLWLGVAALGYLLFRPAYAGAERFAIRFGFPRITVAFGGVLAASIAMTLLVWAAHLLLGIGLGVEGLALIYRGLLALGVVLTLLFWVAERLSGIPAPLVRPTPAVHRAYPPFMQRLPERLHGELLALERVGNGVRVHTDRGSGTLDVAFAAALAELGEADGFEPAPGWWVERPGVERTEADRLVLRNGLEVPIAPV